MEVKPVKGFDRIFTLERCQEEIKQLYKDNNVEKKNFEKFLLAQLTKIENRNETVKHEEPIIYKNEKFYSIRRRAKKNTRVLYYYIKNGNIILLTAFDEKRASDYERAKERAYARLRTLRNNGSLK